MIMSNKIAHINQLLSKQNENDTAWAEIQSKLRVLAAYAPTAAFAM